MAQVQPRFANEPEPAWDIAYLYPPQGQWTEWDYLEATHSTNRLVELVNGRLHVLEFPTMSHQQIVGDLTIALRTFAEPRRLGEALFAALRVRISERTFREPDVVFMLAKNASRAGEDYWDGADLVMEVVSKDPESRRRDLVLKRRDYAAAHISEYWIVDPEESMITVLKLDGDEYAVHGEFKPGEAATSVLLDGFSVNVSEVFEAAKP